MSRDHREDTRDFHRVSRDTCEDARTHPREERDNCEDASECPRVSRDNITSKPSRRSQGRDHTRKAEGAHESTEKLAELPEMPLAVERVVLHYADMFTEKLARGGDADVESVSIHIPTGKQVYVPPRPTNPNLLSELREEIENMRKAGIIEPSHARHNTPLHVVKKSNGKLRVCADLRALNAVCEKFEWEFPRLDVAVSRMTTARIFSKLDLTSGFWQLSLNPESRDVTTFRFDGRTWRFAVVPFGWKGAPAAFQSCMDTVLEEGKRRGFLTVYMDDILVHSRTLEDHVEHLQWTLRTLEKARFRLNPKKCIFGTNEVEFLGHLVSEKGIKPVPSKLDTIQGLKAPKNIRELRGCIGTLGFYQNFVPGYSTLMRPLTSLLTKKTPFKWTTECNEALCKIKEAFANINPMDYSDPENTSAFELTTDASGIAIGAQLKRIDHEGNKTVVANVGRALTGAETRYSNTERELLAITWAFGRLEILIAGKVVHVRTDHAALIPILTGEPRKVSTARVERLRQKLIKFIPTGVSVEHIAGKSNAADSLSRLLGPQTCLRRQQLPTEHGAGSNVLGGEELPQKGAASLAPLKRGKRRQNRGGVPRVQARDENTRAVPKRGRGRPRKEHPEITPDEAEAIVNDDEEEGETNSSSDETSVGREDSAESRRDGETIGETNSPMLIRADEVIAAQQGDRESKILLAWLRDKKGPEPIAGGSGYVQRNGIIYHPRADPRSSKMVYRLYIPANLREKVMRAAHTAGHVGYAVSAQLLESYGYWSSFRRDLREFIDKCLTCKERSALSSRDVLGEAPTPLHPWHSVGMDLLQLPVSKRGHKYLLVLVDLLTRYAVALPLKDKSASRVAEAIRKGVFDNKLLGPPAVIVSDNGLEFSNQTLESLLKKNGVRHSFTTPYNPKANGSTERLNRTILSLLRGVLTPGIEWDESLETVLEIYNNSPHSATRLSPYEAITGRPPRPPHLSRDCQGLLDVQSIQLSESTAPGTNGRLRARLGSRANFSEAWGDAEKVWSQHLELHFGQLRESHTENKHARRRVANKGRESRQLTRDDLVVLRDVHRPPGVEGKLRRPYLGPWVVTQVTRNNTLRLADLEGHELPRLVPFDHVRLWKTDTPSV